MRGAQAKPPKRAKAADVSDEKQKPDRSATEAAQLAERTGNLGKLARDIGYYSAAGFELAALVAAGLFLGGFLDGKLGMGPWLTIAGTSIGFAGGLYNMVLILKRIK